MTPRPAKWSKTVGTYGCRVTVATHPRTPMLQIRWWDKATRKTMWRSLGHADRERAVREAKQLASDLLGMYAAAAPPVAPGRGTLRQVFARFERDAVPHVRALQAREDRRRLAIWTAFLGPDAELGEVDPTTFDRFIRERRAGKLQVPDHTLKTTPSNRAIAADLEFLRRVCNWARLVRVAGVPLLERNPLHGYRVPTNPSPKRPLATYDRYLAVRTTADAVDPRRLFGPFLDLVEGLGWRVSAVCQLRASDFDTRQDGAAPFGRIRKRGETDKEGIEMWVPMSGQVRDAGVTAIQRSGAVGDAYLFPARRRPGQPWSRFYARSLLQRAEQAAGLSPLEGGDFHPYRRAWATARKHLPVTDVAQAGGWKSTTTLTRHYMQADEETLYAVVAEERKVRARRATEG